MLRFSTSTLPIVELNFKKTRIPPSKYNCDDSEYSLKLQELIGIFK